MTEILYQDGEFYIWKDKDSGLFIIAKSGFVCGRIVGHASDIEKAKETIEWHKKMDEKQI